MLGRDYIIIKIYSSCLILSHEDKWTLWPEVGCPKGYYWLIPHWFPIIASIWIYPCFGFSAGSVLLIFFVFHVCILFIWCFCLFVCLFVCLFALSSFCCSSAQCFQYLSIVHFRLLLRGSLALTFLIFTIRFFDEIVLCYHHWIPVISVSALVWLIKIYIIEIYSP